MKRKDLYNYVREEIINELTTENQAADIAAQTAKKQAIDKEIIALQQKKAEISKNPNPLAEEELNEMSRIAKKVSVSDLERIKIAKEVYGGSNVEKIIDLVVEAGEEGTTQEELAAKLNISDPRLLNSDINLLVKAGAFKKSENKPVKSPKASPDADLASIGIPKVTDNPEVDDDELVAVEKDEWETPEKEEEKPEEPKASDIKAADKEASKVIGGKSNAQSLSPEDQETYTKFKNAIDKRLAILKDKKSTDEELKISRALLSKYKANKDLASLFRKKGLNLTTYING
jgi:hypothetical protein